MSRCRSFRHRLLPLFAAALLLCASLPAFALGLGQIVVKSKPGQPLVAEIPIISSDPDELQGLQAQQVNCFANFNILWQGSVIGRHQAAGGRIRIGKQLADFRTFRLSNQRQQ